MMRGHEGWQVLSTVGTAQRRRGFHLRRLASVTTRLSCTFHHHSFSLSLHFSHRSRFFVSIRLLTSSSLHPFTVEAIPTVSMDKATYRDATSGSDEPATQDHGSVVLPLNLAEVEGARSRVRPPKNNFAKIYQDYGYIALVDAVHAESILDARHPFREDSETRELSSLRKWRACGGPPSPVYHDFCSSAFEKAVLPLSWSINSPILPNCLALPTMRR